MQPGRSASKGVARHPHPGVTSTPGTRATTPSAMAFYLYRPAMWRPGRAAKLATGSRSGFRGAERPGADRAAGRLRARDCRCPAGAGDGPGRWGTSGTVRAARAGAAQLLLAKPSPPGEAQPLPALTCPSLRSRARRSLARPECGTGRWWNRQIGRTPSLAMARWGPSPSLAAFSARGLILRTEITAGGAPGFRDFKVSIPPVCIWRNRRGPDAGNSGLIPGRTSAAVVMTDWRPLLSPPLHPGQAAAAGWPDPHALARPDYRARWGRPGIGAEEAPGRHPVGRSPP
jgi:hypothetical protein